MIVDINNRQSLFDIRETEPVIEDSIAAALETEGLDKDVEVSVSLVGKDEIRNLNKIYRYNDSVTDVLSFPAEETFLQTTILGDIVLCIPRAKEQAEELGHDLVREISYLTVHSMFHLMGYDHMNEDDKKIMRRKEKETMARLGIYKNEQGASKKQ